MLKNTNQNKKVFVGLSGGVDSSVSALLLQKAGFDVTGVFIKAWHPDFLPCNWRSEMRDAMRVCAKLSIPFLMCDLEKEYKTEVIDDLISEYKAGRTPNPDVLCNKQIKFGAFLNWAIEKGADYVATGHYAQRKDLNTESCGMFKSVDTEKDQTYFLWTVTPEKLQKILFPIGHLPKKEVRKIAEKNNLHTASKKDSQGLCFVGHVDMKSFLRRFIETKNGDVLNTNGQIIGKHSGSELYTIGERHGFTIFEKSENLQNHYIISKDLNKNTITVSDQPEINELVSEIFLTKVNFINLKFKEEINKKNKLNLEIKVRYRGILHPASIIKNEKSYKIILDIKIEGVAIGQSVVFYSEDECFGGGIIEKVL